MNRIPGMFSKAYEGSGKFSRRFRTSYTVTLDRGWTTKEVLGGTLPHNPVAPLHGPCRRFPSCVEKRRMVEVTPRLFFVTRAKFSKPHRLAKIIKIILYLKKRPQDLGRYFEYKTAAHCR